VLRADNLTTLVCRLSRNLGALTSWTPQGHAGLFRGYFTFTVTFTFRYFPQHVDYCISRHPRSKEALSTGQAMAMAVSRRTLNFETQFRFRSGPFVICNMKSGNVKRFSPSSFLLFNHYFNRTVIGRTSWLILEILRISGDAGQTSNLSFFFQ
jgi:hypothetical protein